MDFDKLYTMRGAWLRSAMHFDPLDNLSNEEVIALSAGDKRPDRPIRLKWHSGGNKLVDWVATTFPPMLLVSDALISLLKKKSFTGWSTYPVEVIGRDGVRINGYHGLAITGKCGPIDRQRSIEIQKEPMSPQGKPYRVLVGLYFDEESWDGSDLFTPEGTSHILVTESVRNAVVEERLTNMSFTKLTEEEASPADLP